MPDIGNSLGMGMIGRVYLGAVRMNRWDPLNWPEASAFISVVATAGVVAVALLADGGEVSKWPWDALSSIGSLAAVATAIGLAWRGDRRSSERLQIEGTLVAARLSTELNVQERALKIALASFSKAEQQRHEEPWSAREHVDQAFAELRDLTPLCDANDLVRLSHIDAASAERLSKANGLILNLHRLSHDYLERSNEGLSSVSFREFSVSAARCEVAIPWIAETRRACTRASTSRFKIPERWRQGGEKYAAVSASGTDETSS
jgi:hypothetical protein